MDKFKKNMLKVQETLEPDKISLLDDNRLLAENSIENEMEAAESIESFETEEQIENLTDPEDVYNYVLNFINEGKLSWFVDIEDIKTGCKLKIPAYLYFEKGESVLKREAYATFDKLGTILQIVRGNIVIDANTEKVTKEIDYYRMRKQQTFGEKY